MTQLINLMIAGSFPIAIDKFFLGGQLIALEKKDGGVRPIAIGYIIRRLMAKCANHYVIARRSKSLKTIQLGVGVPGGTEAAVNATRCLLSPLPTDHVMLKLDFTTALNSVRRYLSLETTSINTSELYQFVHATSSCDPILSYGSHKIRSKEGFQQGDPLSALEFCETVQPLLSSLDSDVNLGFMDHFTILSPADIVECNVWKISSAASKTGLLLNPTRCEIISFETQSRINPFSRNTFIPSRQTDITWCPSSQRSGHRLVLTAKLMTLQEPLAGYLHCMPMMPQASFGTASA